MDDLAPDKLEDLMDRYVFGLLEAEAADQTRQRIESDPKWQVAYEAAVQRQRILTAGVRPADGEPPEHLAGADEILAAADRGAEPDDAKDGATAPGLLLRLIGRGKSRKVSGESDGAKDGETPPKLPRARRRVTWRYWAVAAAILLLNAGGLIWIRYSLLAQRDALPKLRVVQALPAGDVDDADRFTLVFGQELIGEDQVNTRPKHPLFVITPAPPGEWKWTARNRLEYILKDKLPPGRRYTLAPADDLERRLGRVLVNPRPRHFQTRPLRLKSCDLHSSDRDHVTVELKFNQPVDPKDFSRHVRFTTSGGRHTGEPVVIPVLPGEPGIPLPAGPAAPSPSLEARILTQSPDETITVRLTRPTSKRLQVALDEKLKGPGAQVGLGERVVRTLEVSPRLTLLRADPGRPRFDKNSSVALVFTSPLDHNQRLPKVTVEPAVKDVKASWNYRGLELLGPFEPGKRYTATVPGTLLARDGQTLGNAQAVTFEIPHRYAGVRIPHGSGLLSPKGNLNLDIEAVNVPGLKVRVWRVHADNIVSHLLGNPPDETARDLKTKVIPLDSKQDKIERMTFDLRALLDNPLGVYRIRAESAQSRWNNARSIVTVTDLVLTVKQHRTGLMAWVTSLKTSRPLAGVTVTAVTRNNRPLARGKTGPDGAVRLDIPPKHPDGKVFVVLAQLGRDLSCLRPGEHQWVIDGVDTSGRHVPETYDVMLYTDRGVYRPGETVHVTGLVRDPIGRVPRPFPLEVSVRRPDGREVTRLPAMPEAGAQGMFHVDFDTRANGQTGTYRFTAVLPGADKPLGTCRTFVEAYVPLRMEVGMVPIAPRVGPGEKAEVSISARYLWGEPAADLRTTVAATCRTIRYRSASHPDYTFGRAKTLRWTPDDVAASLDAKGHAQLALPDIDKKQPPALWKASVSATVTETGGRSVSANTTMTIDPLDCHLGLRLTPRRVVRAGDPIRLDWVRLTGTDKPAPDGEMTLHVDRIENDWVLKDVNGRTVWTSRERKISVLERKIGPGGSRGHVAFTCDQPGTHRATIVDAKTASTTVIEWYALHPSAGRATVAMNEPERLKITLDKKQYRPGERAHVVVQSPLSGTALITMESDRVVAYGVVPVRKNAAEVLLEIPKTLRGGAFVTATVIRPLACDQAKWLPHRAMGMARLETIHDDHKLPLRLTAPAKARPGQEIEVSIDAGSPLDPAHPTVVHLWAVDEGILLTTNYQTPDPMKHFFAHRQLGVTSADAFGLLLPDNRRPAGMARIGADGDEESDMGALRRNPVATRQRVPAVFWQRALPLRPDGRLTVRLPLPDLTGRMRIMAVAADGDRYGSAAAPVTLTTPMMLEVAWPRFAAPGDAFDVPVKLFNSTDRQLRVHIAAALSGPARLEGAPTTEILVPAKTPAVHWLRVTATGMGAVEAVVQAREISSAPAPLQARRTGTFPVRPATALHTVTDVQRVKGGGELVLDAPKDFVPHTARRKLHISPRPVVQLLPAIEQLLDYPYGCVEQTTSRLYPMLYAPDLILQADAKAGRSADRATHVAHMIRAGIDRLWSMQTRSGGLAYWPGGRQPALWGTAYAAAFLLEAKTHAGYAVDAKRFRELAKYLEGRLAEDESLDPNQQALICRVLATAGRARRGWMARLLDQPDKLDLAGRAHLAAAYLAIGRKDLARKALPKDTLQLAVAKTTAGRITGPVRQQAVLLGVLLDLDPDHPWVPAIVQRLEAARTKGQWGNTLANATALSALARYELLQDRQPNYRGTVQVGSGEPVAFSHVKPLVLDIPDGQAVRIRTEGTTSAYVTSTIRGLAREGVVQPYDRGLKVRRTWTDRQGRPVDPENLNVGDLVYVAVELSRPAGGEPVHNVAIVDALPAGLEVENPRLASSVAGHERVEGSRPDRVEFLDDRVVLFSTASREVRRYYYAIRCTTAGEFTVPPIQASCMYDDAVASMGASSTVRVHK